MVPGVGSERSMSVPMEPEVWEVPRMMVPTDPILVLMEPNIYGLSFQASGT